MSSLPSHRKTADPVRKGECEQLGIPSPIEKTEAALRERGKKNPLPPFPESRFPLILDGGGA